VVLKLNQEQKKWMAEATQVRNRDSDIFEFGAKITNKEGKKLIKSYIMTQALASVL
jgi:hypothetical protein